ncbi:nucleotidyl transferase AbiEii/AbiGii toxin family protein [Hyphomonas sp.]|uniref:nucleotidyl transferase AbiEii/AbiGii toxin family protein n=1 Tax=Hyphomonas sp. TaxID=87 RepID=UPI000C3A019D|nr:nucleotidyl transferase AbiEii/AbiGii toxin family protein [Hyphomonas sp.]MAB12178.1 hypothetical protein [Hyphomonas sp.]MAT94078.1 hypothetical protein [Halioglobus sp.]MBM59672.1 hypothetical protein [Hyphomonas sp.]
MTDRATYEGQVALLVRVLPIVAEEACFALKGGTAINLFYRDMPRLSVDIDLVYVPIKPRAKSHREIDQALDRIAAAIERRIAGARCRRVQGGGNLETRMIVTLTNVSIKIEVNPNMRGLLVAPRLNPVSEAVEDRFGFAEANLVAFEEVYAGKLVAALDRQHPRDLFDILLLKEGDGITDELLSAFLIYLSCSPRPMHELLSPNLSSLEERFELEFAGMTVEPVELVTLEASRAWLISELQSRLTGNAATYLRGLHDAEPDVSLIGRPAAGNLPAIAWKLQNIETLKRDNPDRYHEVGQLLEALLH